MRFDVKISIDCMKDDEANKLCDSLRFYGFTPVKQGTIVSTDVKNISVDRYVRIAEVYDMVDSTDSPSLEVRKAIDS